MERLAGEIIVDIERFCPIDGNWLPLDDLLEELWATGSAGEYIAELLAVLV